MAERLRLESATVGTGGTGADETTAAALTPPAPSVPSMPFMPSDSLFYSIQVAAFSQAAQAVSYAEDFHDDEAATVSPVQLGRQGLWFRVIIGAYAAPEEADSVLRELWSRGVVERPSGTILRTPHTFRLERAASLDAARERAEGLRRRGVAAYIVPAPDGTALVAAGAFENPDQARAADSLLRLSGLEATLTHRMGTK